MVKDCQKREELYLANLERKIIGSLDSIGAKTVDMLALKQLCKQGGSLLAGGWHCRNIESDLIKLGWKCTKSVEIDLFCRIPLFPEQIRNYFKASDTQKSVG